MFPGNVDFISRINEIDPLNFKLTKIPICITRHNKQLLSKDWDNKKILLRKKKFMLAKDERKDANLPCTIAEQFSHSLESETTKPPRNNFAIK